MNYREVKKITPKSRKFKPYGEDGIQLPGHIWLEPYELPTEEEIIEIFELFEGTVPVYTGTGVTIHALYKGDYKKAAKAITKLIKGER